MKNADAGRSKRADGEGTIAKYGERWRGRLMVGTRPDGRPDRRVVYGKTQAECREKLDALKAKHFGGQLPDSDKARETVASYLTRWAETTKTSVRPKTARRYRELVELHIVPALGRHKLTTLKPDHVQKFYADMLAQTDAKTGRHWYSPRTVHHCHRVLHRALEMAVRWNYIPLNVCDRVEAPRVPKVEIIPPTPAELGALLDAAEKAGDPLAPLWATAIYSGCRLGELLALKWTDLDLERGSLTVRRTLVATKAGVPEYGEPKSTTSRRTLALPTDAITTLKAHRDRQAFERQALGDAWADYGLVFVTQIGTAFLAADVSHKFKRALKRAGLADSVRFHDVRHASATMMLLAGVAMKMTSARLGHSTITLTANTYQHVTRELDADAADRLGMLFRKAREDAV